MTALPHAGRQHRAAAARRRALRDGLRWLAGALLALQAQAAAALERPDLSFSASVDAFGGSYRTRDEAPFNPGNLIALLPSSRLDLVFKGSIAARLGDLHMRVDPRLAASTARFNGQRDDEEYAEFHRIGALMAELTGQSHTLNLVAAGSRERTHLGLFGQWTVNDEMLAYVDWGWRSRTDARVPVRDGSALGWALAPQQRRGLHEVLVGATYTVRWGDTVGLELRHNQQGLSSSEFAALRHLVADATAASAEPGQAAGAASLLASASELCLRSLRRNYLHAQYLVRELVPNLGVNVLAIHNLDDHGTQWIGVVNYYAGRNTRLSLKATLNKVCDRGNWYGVTA